MTAADAIVIGKILPGLRGLESVLLKQVAHRSTLVMAMFEQQPARAGEMPRGGVDDLPDRIEAIGA